MMKLVEQGRYSMQDLVQQFDLRVVKKEQFTGVALAYELHNINSRKDLKNLER